MFQIFACIFSSIVMLSAIEHCVIMAKYIYIYYIVLYYLFTKGSSHL